MSDYYEAFLGVTAKVLDAATVIRGTYLDPETKVRHVRDADFWGMPVGTPIVAGMKPKASVVSNAPHVVSMAAPRSSSRATSVPRGLKLSETVWKGWEVAKYRGQEYHVGKEGRAWYLLGSDDWDDELGRYKTRQEAIDGIVAISKPKRVVRRKKPVTPEPRATVRKTVNDKVKDARFASLRLAKASLQEKDPDAQAELMERAHHYAREANKVIAGAKPDTNPDWQGNLRNPFKYDSPYATNLYQCDMELIRRNMIETHMALATAKPAIIAQKNPAKAASQLRRLYKELVAAADVDAENGYGSDQALDNLLNVIERLTVTYADMAKGSR